MKKFFSLIFAVVLLITVVVPAFAADIPENPEAWLASQSFKAPVCNPQSYDGWLEAEFDSTGGQVDHLDMVATPYQTFVVWGTGVSVDGKDYGRSLIVLNGGASGGRWHVVINDGAYRVGVDQWGFFPKYWQPILICLYGGQFPITNVGEWVVPVVEVEKPATAEPETIIETVEFIEEVPVENIVSKEVEVEKEVKVPTPFTPAWVWWVLVALVAALLWALLRKPRKDTTAPPATASKSAPKVTTTTPPATEDDLKDLKGKVSSAKGNLTRAENALSKYTGSDPAQKAKLEKAVKIAGTNRRKAEKALKDAQTPASVAP